MFTDEGSEIRRRITESYVSLEVISSLNSGSCAVSWQDGLLVTGRGLGGLFSVACLDCKPPHPVPTSRNKLSAAVRYGLSTEWKFDVQLNIPK